MNKKWKRINRDLHRDIGYFCTTLVIVYCVSGIAFNHINEWNPDFILQKDTVLLDRAYLKKEINETWIKQQLTLSGEKEYKLYDFPTTDQVKIYMTSSTLHLYFTLGYGIYESIRRRPLIYQMNVLHRNNVKYWKWASDIFAVLLIGINLTGLLILKGKYGLTGRGKWWMALGLVIPILMFIFWG